MKYLIILIAVLLTSCCDKYIETKTTMKVDSIRQVTNSDIIETRHFTYIYVSNDTLKGIVTGFSCKEGDTIPVILTKMYCGDKYSGYMLTTK